VTAEIRLEKQKGQAVDNTRLVNLQKALVETRQAQVNEIERRLPFGRDAKITVLEAAQKLMEAQLALATDKKSRIRIMDSCMRRLIEYESLLHAELQAGKCTAFEVAQVSAKRLMAEILLEKEKGN